MPTARVLVVVPTYDEAENVGPLARRLLAAVPEATVLFVDDASPDGTGDRVARLAARDPRIRLLARPAKLGLGSAYQAGFAAGIAEGFGHVVTMDADHSHDPTHLPALLAAAGDHDLVVGSRYVPGGGIVNWGLHRRLLSTTANALARRVLALPVHDVTSGYRVYGTAALATLPLAGVRSSGYAFLEEVLWLAVRHGLRVGEVPIVFTDREGGRSKISAVEIAFAVYRLGRLALTDLGRAARRRQPVPPPLRADAPEN